MRPLLTHLRFIIICVFFAGCGDSKNGPREAADQFFALCANGKAAEAYASASGIFQIERSAKYFQARVRELGFDTMQGVTWTPLDTPGRARTLRGEFKLKDGHTVPLIVSVVQDSGRWCLLGVKIETPAGVVNEDLFAVAVRSQDSEAESNKALLEPVAATLPTERQLEKLAEKALLEFDDAVKKNDFQGLYDSASDRWKFRGKDPRVLTYPGKDKAMIEKSDPYNKAQRLTKTAMEHAFRGFVEANTDITPIKGKKMILDEPANLNSEGVLTLIGHYDAFVFQGGLPPTPCKMNFQLEFVQEGSQWKSFGFTVNFLAPGAR